MNEQLQTSQITSHAGGTVGTDCGGVRACREIKVR